MRFIGWLQARQPEKHVDLQGPEYSPETNAIVVGYGRFGQTVSQMLMAKRIPVTLIDIKAEQIELAGQFDTKVYYGDGTRIDLLRTAGAEEAEGIFFCIDDADLGPEQLQPIVEAFPKAKIMVRTFDRRHMLALKGLGLAWIQRELYDSAIVMGRQALGSLGIAAREVDRVEQEYRSRDRERLRVQHESGNLRTGLERSFTHAPLED
jgi:voltage-gated potassium channel Kch